jgi:predicted GNAT family acetyltransferase
MQEIQLVWQGDKNGAFVIEEDGKRLAEMVFGLEGKNLSVFHTEVAPELEGKGVAKMLLQRMVEYAREEGDKVLPFCPFVHAQFRRHPDQYADIWDGN